MSAYKEMADAHSNATSLKESQPDKALQYYATAIDKAKEVHPDYEGAYSLEASTFLFELERYDEAVKYAKRAADVTMRGYTYTNAKIFQGVILYRIGKEKKNDNYYHEAIACFDEIIENHPERTFHPDTARALKNKGNALSLLKKYHSAIECYDKAIKILPTYMSAFTNKGNAYYGLKNYKEAINCYNKALAVLDKTSEVTNMDEVIAITYLHRAQANYNLGDISTALKEFDNIDDGKLSPYGKASRHTNMGLCYYKKNLLDKAEQSYLAAIEYFFDLPHAHYNLAILYLKTKSRDEAREQFLICAKNNGPLGEKAVLALKELEASHGMDWYRWWFGKSKSKKFLGVTLIGLILLVIGTIAYLSATAESLKPTNLTGLSLAAGLLIAILLLPSLKKVKLGRYVELDVVGFVSASAGDELEVITPFSDHYGRVGVDD